MKKILFICLSLIFILVTVTGIVIAILISRVYNIRDEVYELGLEAIVIVDGYIDTTITLDESKNKILEISNAIDAIDNIGLAGSESDIRRYISTIYVRFSDRRNLDNINEEILMTRNKLAETLKQPIREEVLAIEEEE